MIQEITIRLHPNGNVEINAPVENKILCYGLLETAKKVIADYVPPIIQPVKPLSSNTNVLEVVGEGDRQG